MDNIVEKIETFLAFSDDKLAELEKENQKLKKDHHHTKAK
ncbi:SP_0009 family protein [Streptococcus equi]|uniref:Uncharacterized protein n=1 Tax=Streptococcus equi subsp. ruminatorum CECT 5772 TaxID=1051981 RepID=A0A922T408_9STRE|nr:SP_0009 family protein [Streptococcus equi]KED04930.1 hypothetical protein CECT5772_02848 [Streptococcus equi subsp. ruminatorum CECT 5772]MDI5988856.1 SP_0009 family protein [Streptococcus equi subsp. zooepidemicus]MDI6043896.1 SP_0009 family protein [Streptococcus equi subsp. zooepidemicus]